MKCLFLSLFYVLILNSASAQIEWAPIGAEWNYSQYLEGNMPLNISNIKINPFADTVISNITMSQLERIFTRSSGIESRDTFLTYKQNDQVYINKSDDFSKFELIYDFNKKVGDTINTYFIDVDDYFSFVVDSISFLEIDGELLKVTHIQDNCFNYGPRIIENIGSEEGLIPSICLVTGEVESIYFNCYFDNNISYMVNEDCDFWGTVNTSNQTDELFLEIYPNPTSDYITIQPFEALVEAEYQFFNANGRLVVFGTLEKENKINISNLDSGVYFLKIMSGNDYSHSTRKVVIH